MTSYRNITAVLFDLDSTLIEHTRDLGDLCGETYGAFADKLAPISQDEFREAFWPKNRDMWYMVVDGVLTGDAARLYSFVNTLRSLNADDRLAGPMLDDWEGRIIAATRLFDDALATMGRLRLAGKRLGIVTNGFTTMQTRKIRHHCLDAHVDFALISEQVGAYKPDKAIFDLALAQAEVAARQAVFIGDTPSTDIEGARNAGLHPVLMESRYSRAEVEGDEVPRIRRLKELLPLLELA